MEGSSPIGKTNPGFNWWKQLASSHRDWGICLACFGSLDFVRTFGFGCRNCVRNCGHVGSTRSRLLCCNFLCKRSPRPKKCKSCPAELALVSYEPESTRSLTACITNLVVAPGPEETRCCST